MGVIEAANMMYSNQTLSQLKLQEEIVERDLKFYTNLEEKLKNCRSLACQKNIVHPDDCGKNIQMAQSKLALIKKALEAKL